MIITSNAHFTRIPIIGVRHLDDTAGRPYTEINLRNEADSIECITLFIPGHVYVGIGEVINGDD